MDDGGIGEKVHLVLIETQGNNVVFTGHQVVGEHVVGSLLGFEADIDDGFLDAIDDVQLRGPAVGEYFLSNGPVEAKQEHFLGVDSEVIDPKILIDEG